MKPSASLAGRLRERRPMLATFIKTPGIHAVEIAGIAGIDCVVLDAEHAPFSQGAIDTALLACRAAGVYAIVRVPDAGASTLGQVLDMGADGVLVPHVCTAEQAREVVAACRYRAGHRGYSNSPRAGRYGAVAMQAHVAQQDSSVAVLCQIEDRAAIGAVDAIAAVDGVDCLFVGRADLAVSFGCFDLAHPDVERAQADILAAAATAGVAAGTFIAEMAGAASLIRQGARFLVVGSDQSVLRGGFAAMVRAFAEVPSDIN